MTDGRIAIIDSGGKIHTSVNFSTGMAPDDYGEEVIEFLERIHNIDHFVWSVEDFNEHHFIFDGTLIEEVSGDWFNTRYDYFNKWSSDYVYIKNLSSETKYFVTPDGFVALPPNEILTLNWGKLISEEKDKLAHVNVGDIVTVADIEWIVLEKTDDSVFCLTKNFVDITQFDSKSPNYETSELREKLQKFSQNLKNKLGKNALIPKTIDLTTNEGKILYRSPVDEVGLLTENEYKEFESIIEKYPVGKYWWLATADSRWSDVVRCVNNVGALDDNFCGYNYGVRPFCIFSSKIF